MATTPVTNLQNTFTYPYEVPKSIWLDGANDTLNKTMDVTGSTQTATYSIWFKRSTITSGSQCLLGGRTDANNQDWILINSGDYINIWSADTGTTHTNLTTTQKFRDTSAWYHCCVVWDFSNSVQKNRCKLFINGKRITDFSAETYPSDTAKLFGHINISGKSIDISDMGDQNYYWKGYIAQPAWVDGLALGPESFGRFHHGVWVPIDISTPPAGAGVNSFYLDFASATADATGVGYNRWQHAGPTTAFVDDEYTSLLMHCDAADTTTVFIDSSSWAHPMTAVSTVQHDTGITPKVDSSSALFNGTSDRITIPKSDAFDFGTDDFTIEGWFYWNDIAQSHGLIQAYVDGTHNWSWYYNDATDKLQFIVQDGTIKANYVCVSAIGHSTGIWYHMAIQRVGTKMELYIDGVVIPLTETTAFSTNAVPRLNSDISLGYQQDSGMWMDGHMDEIRISKGIARYGASVNNFTPTSFTTANQTEDTPTNNWCTLNPLQFEQTPVLTNANLQWSKASGEIALTSTTFAVNSGKWYWEIEHDVATGTVGEMTGINSTDADFDGSGAVSDKANGYGLCKNGNVQGTGISPTAYSSVITSGQIVGMAFDADIGALWFSINGTWQGYGTNATISEIQNGDTTNSAFSGIDMNKWYTPSVSGNNTGVPILKLNFGQNAFNTTGGNADGNGYGDFDYTVPTGFLSLCSQNLPDPEILQGDEHFDINLNDGNNDGTNPRVMGNYKFMPSLFWGKDRVSITNNHAVADRVRGVQKFFYITTGAENTGQTSAVLSYNKSSVTGKNTPGWNGSNDTVQWVWRADEHVAGMTKGAGTSKPYSGLVNRRAGFSIIGYAGNGSAGLEIPHHLDKPPEFWIVKNRVSIQTWVAGHKDLTSAVYYMEFNGTAAEQSGATIWNSTPPSATTVTVSTGTQVNVNDADCIMYSFHSVPGYSMVGSYVGNGNADGTFVYCGFRPRWVMMKLYSGAATSNWQIHDGSRNPFNPADDILYANLTNAEAAASYVDLLSNGFKIRHTNVSENTDAYKYIFYAIAETPFKYSNAR